MRFPVYGTLAIGPLLGSLRLVPSLTKEQRDQLPLILETIGPSIIPALVRHLHDPHEHVRAIVAAALGRLQALEAVPLLAALVRDPSEVVRQSVVEALGVLGSPRPDPPAPVRGRGRGRGARGRAIWLVFRWRKHVRVDHHTATRSSWPWRRWSPLWPTIRPQCGPRPPGRWAGSGRPPRRLAPGLIGIVEGAGRNGSLPGGHRPWARSEGTRRRRWPRWSSC